MRSRAPVLAVVTAVAVVQALTDRTRVPAAARGGASPAGPPAPSLVPGTVDGPAPAGPPAPHPARVHTPLPSPRVPAAPAVTETAAGRRRPRSTTLAGLVGLPALALALPTALPASDTPGPTAASVASAAAPGSAGRAADTVATAPAPATGGVPRTAAPPVPLAAARERLLAERAAVAEAEALRAARSDSARGTAARRAAARAATEAQAARPRAAAPVAAPAGSPFGYRWGRLHAGLDFPAPLGTPITAVADGVVEQAGPASGYGYLVTVRHGDGTTTAYGHMRVIDVRPGQSVLAGQVIAQVGNEGRSTGPHLHFEVRTPDGPLDPRPWLAERGVQV